ncbi:methenyltetrahydromethanopterin cyclohydrolase [Rhodopirellula sp. MGV]|uniref:methenyltetrahydromethanopterin cyclohydrolase n=1 Tax=Rhodopirellula sp. MGV TaxID=2023130 RepID=UPI000B961A9D|nr:methenyltetrahydromethanopterin cyclohydrolase [Rhodopirellula sp. MGV]OYP32301.1 methenyltetrahydromethanopterin cyclohydrolase [Rhodopirellula sp. MGV]PNY35914.1 methenyltetrahydromethanopterin cyclohydrolase [Rhodopirellula baltica]
MQVSPNQNAIGLLHRLVADPISRVCTREIGGATVYDFGVETLGSARAGRDLARVCMGGLGHVRIAACDSEVFASSNQVLVQTDAPLIACLGCQYAGWPVQVDDYFAMGSGPARMLRGREAVLEKYNLRDTEASIAIAVLESETLPTPAVIDHVADQVGISVEHLKVCIAPCTTLSGSIQVVARSIETALHKIDELGFDVASIVSACGSAPLPPPAKRGDIVSGIGRTNDAMLYGAEVTLYVDADDDAIEAVYRRVPSGSSDDYGRPFAKIFADYDFDFYKVDPSLFSPAVVTICSLQSGRSFRAGKLAPEVLRESFLK